MSFITDLLILRTTVITNAAREPEITDLADYLVKKGMPFRTAYKAVGELVAECIEKNTVLDKLPLDAYKCHSELFDEDLYTEISLETCVEKRISELIRLDRYLSPKEKEMYPQWLEERIANCTRGIA